MNDVQEKETREIAKKILSEKKVDIIIGYEKGTIPLRSSPLFLTDENETGKLVWNSFCSNNLAVYLPCLSAKRNLGKGKVPPKIGIVAKGCDTRSIVGLIKEKQIQRDNLFIVGIPCNGMIDGKKIKSYLGRRKLNNWRDEEDSIILVTEEDRNLTCKKSDFLYDVCIYCQYSAPGLCDIRLSGETRKEEGKGIDTRFKKIKEFESMSQEERWEYFKKEISKCIRCYACRQACPNCYCPVCFAEETRPKWIGSSLDISDVMIYHIGRIFHQAGRCVDCGACARACPMNIDLRLFTQKLVKDVEEKFGYSAGRSLEDLPPLCTFKMEDNQDFITEPG